MKKLLTFAAALLASVSMFAATLTLNGSWVSDPEGYFTKGTKESYNNKFTGGEYAGISFTKGLKMESGTAVNFTTTDVTIVTVVQSSSYGSDKTILFDGEALANSTTGTGCLIYTLSNVTAGTHAITRGSGETGIFYVAVEAACTDPEFTVLPTEGTGFVGDPIDIAVTSKNQSKPINAAVTVDGVAGVYGTDYTFSVSTGLVQATPLRAGTFVITFTQASNGTYCDAEASSTFVISEKTPVTSFKVEGPTSARVGDEITLTATDFNANPTRVWWLDTETGETIHEGATYTFKADAEGEVWYFVLARNDFNNPDEEEDDYAHGMMGSVNVTMGHNAYLSDLKVNGVTIEGFDNEVFEYDLGEIGVYEPVEVTATAADEPYATATINPGNNNVLVTVFAQDKTTYHSYVITYTRKAATELASISESTTWDFTKTGATTIQLSETTLPTKTQEFVYADLLTTPDESFNAAALAGIQEYVVRDGKFAQGSQLSFVTTVPGTLEVVYSNTGNRTDEGDRRFLVVNGEKIGEGSMKSNETVTESNIAVAAGEVALTGLLNKDESAQYLRFYKIVFTKSEETAIDNAAVDTKAVKVIRDGQVIILRDGKTYNALGTEVR